ncbi:MAG: exodeoxyribonuclease VII large subunit [Gemmatimonadota bacterium]
MTPAYSDENPITTRDPLTVSALNRAVAGLLSRSFPLVRVRGEIANFTRAASGHWYLTLKDQYAQVRCAMFRGRNALVDFAPRDGDEVEVLAQVGLYEPRGEFQLNIESMQRAGLGRLFEEFLRLKTRLAAEGLFDDARKRPLPAVPRAVGIVTSLQAAALHDVLTTLRRRAPYAVLTVYPVPVQGEGAGPRIAKMLERVSQRREVEVVLLVRGGGSIEDLWAFNEEVVSRAIRACAIPVVVGVGHESDFTIADFAADLRAPTPTAAAELVAPDRAGLLQTVAQRLQALRGALRRNTEAATQRFDYALRSLAAPRAPLRGLDLRVASALARLRQASGNAHSRSRVAVTVRLQRLARSRPEVHAARSRLQVLSNRLAAQTERAHKARTNRLDFLSAALHALDPAAVLARGFAMVLAPDGRSVRDAGQLAVGDRLQLRFARGAAHARVEDLERNRDSADRRRD